MFEKLGKTVLISQQKAAEVAHLCLKGESVDQQEQEDLLAQAPVKVEPKVIKPEDMPAMDAPTVKKINFSQASQFAPRSGYALITNQVQLTKLERMTHISVKFSGPLPVHSVHFCEESQRFMPNETWLHD